VSVKNVGDFTFKTFIIVDGSEYLVDQGVVSNTFMPTKGQFIETSGE
jgi:hypothetical protein